MPDSPSIPVIAVAKFLEGHDAPYIVVGAHAVSVFGAPRYSADLDIAIHWPTERQKELRRWLLSAGYSDLAWKEHPQEGARLWALEPSGIPVEFFFTGQSEVAAREQLRRRRVEIAGTKVWVISPEDLVLRKLVNVKFRRGPDFEDAVGVLRVQGEKMDQGYLRSHCRVHRICGLLDDALDEALKHEKGRGAIR